MSNKATFRMINAMKSNVMIEVLLCNTHLKSQYDFK